MRHCNKCGKSSDDAAFGKDNRNKDGLSYKCVTCLKDYNNRYILENKKRIDEYRLKYRDTNKEVKKERDRKWRLDNIEYKRMKDKEYYYANVDKVKEYWKSFREANKEKFKLKKHAEYEANKDRVKERVKEWQAANPIKHRLIKHNARVRREYREALSGWKMTEAWWLELISKYENKCAYCSKTFDDTYWGKSTPDHIIALANGGKHLPENIVPACWKCNQNKCAKTPEEFGVQPRIF